MPADDMTAPHLEVGEVAAYVDRRLAPADRDRVEMHLSECAECRREVIDVARVARTVPPRRHWYWLAPAAAAAVIIGLIVGSPKGNEHSTPLSDHRGQQGAAPGAPLPIAPVGSVTSADTLRWAGVPSTHRYRLRLFDAEGAAIWETQTADTVVAFPNSVRLRTGVSYYWRVEARVGVERWVESALTEFSLVAPGPPR